MIFFADVFAFFGFVIGACSFTHFFPFLWMFLCNILNIFMLFLFDFSANFLTFYGVFSVQHLADVWAFFSDISTHFYGGFCATSLTFSCCFCLIFVPFLSHFCGIFSCFLWVCSFKCQTVLYWLYHTISSGHFVPFFSMYSCNILSICIQFSCCVCLIFCPSCYTDYSDIFVPFLMWYWCHFLAFCHIFMASFSCRFCATFGRCLCIFVIIIVVFFLETLSHFSWMFSCNICNIFI